MGRTHIMYIRLTMNCFPWTTNIVICQAAEVNHGYKVTMRPVAH